MKSIALSASEAATDSAPVCPIAQSFNSTSTPATSDEAKPAEAVRRVSVGRAIADSSWLHGRAT